MNIVIAVVIVVVTTAAAAAAMLFVRRTAPDGGYFNDGDRAAGVFGVLATGFAVLLGFVVFLAFASYDASRAGAEDEALIVAQQAETAQLFPEDVRADLTSGLVCYARSVAGVQWDRMQAGTLGDTINPWAVELFRTLQTVEPDTASQEAAYGKWLDQTSDREAARNDRIHGAAGVIPLPLWIVLFFTSGVIFMYLLFFADSGERASCRPCSWARSLRSSCRRCCSCSSSTTRSTRVSAASGPWRWSARSRSSTRRSTRSASS